MSRSMARCVCVCVWKLTSLGTLWLGTALSGWRHHVTVCWQVIVGGTPDENSVSHVY